jgi:hypothetical protein
MIPQISQGPLGGDNIIGWILQIVWLLFFVVFMFYGQRIQMWVMLREVQSSLLRLKLIRDEGRKIAVSTIKEIGKPQTDPTEKVDRFLEYVTFPPESMDPSGVVWKLEHILDVRDIRFKDEVKLMAPEADESETRNLANTLEAALALNVIYKVIRHFYELGKKNPKPIHHYANPDDPTADYARSKSLRKCSEGFYLWPTNR